MVSVVVRRTAAGADELDRLVAQQLCCGTGTHSGYGVSATVSCQTAAENDSNCSCIFIWHSFVPFALADVKSAWRSRLTPPPAVSTNTLRAVLTAGSNVCHCSYLGRFRHRHRAVKPGVYSLTNLAFGSATPAPQVLPLVFQPVHWGRVSASMSAIKRKASSRLSPHVSALG